MKILLSLLVAAVSIGANAATTKKNSIKLVKAGSVKKMDLDDSYFGPVAVGRISPQTWQVELVGLTVTDPNSTPLVNPKSATVPVRKVKAVLDISPVDPMDSDSVDAARSLLYYFYSVKTGIEYYGENSGGPLRAADLPRPVAKVTSISFNDGDVSVDTVNCIGLDLEIANQATPATKECYRVRPLEVFEHAL